MESKVPETESPAAEALARAFSAAERPISFSSASDRSGARFIMGTDCHETRRAKSHEAPVSGGGFRLPRKDDACIDLARMEIIAEILLQILFFLVELLFSVLGEGLISLFRRKPSARGESAEAGPFLAAFGYAAFGAACGVASLLVAPSHFIQPPLLRWLNLAASPIICGILLASWRSIRASPERPAPFGRDFVNGFCLALALAATRLVLAR